jgi:hypothetical protein
MLGKILMRQERVSITAYPCQATCVLMRSREWPQLPRIQAIHSRVCWPAAHLATVHVLWQDIAAVPTGVGEFKLLVMSELHLQCASRGPAHTLRPLVHTKGREPKQRQSSDNCKCPASTILPPYFADKATD